MDILSVHSCRKGLVGQDAQPTSCGKSYVRDVIATLSGLRDCLQE